MTCAESWMEHSHISREKLFASLNKRVIVQPTKRWDCCKTINLLCKVWLCRLFSQFHVLYFPEVVTYRTLYLVLVAEVISPPTKIEQEGFKNSQREVSEGYRKVPIPLLRTN